ncbi:MAG TPA: MarR family transcriptional regulator, partial [Solirubrobacter sp.]
MLWTQLLGEVLNAEILERLRAEHPRVRYSHGFLIQQLVGGPRPIGEIAENLAVTSQAVSKAVRELEALGYVERWSDPGDGRVRRVALTATGQALLDAGRATRAAINAELAAALGAERAEATALAL